MKLSEWAHAAEIAGAVAIVASLIFVGLEVRENTSMTQLTSDRAVDQQNMALNLAIVQSPDLAGILIRAELDRTSLTELERKRFDNYCLSRFSAYENVVGNYVNGLMPAHEMYIWIEHFNYRFVKPGYRQFWVEYRSGYFPDFRAWADERFGITLD